jgi:hypothetical protein
MYTMGTVLRHGSTVQKQKYLPGIAAGDLRLQAFAVTEPGSGTDTTRIRTRAVRDGDDYVVNGQKRSSLRFGVPDIPHELKARQIAKDHHDNSQFGNKGHGTSFPLSTHFQRQIAVFVSNSNKTYEGYNYCDHE